MTKPQVIVSHPGRQHSHQAALGLAAGDMLSAYISGVPARPLLPSRLWRRVAAHAAVDLPAPLAESAPWVPVMRRVAGLFPSWVEGAIDFLACRAFDVWVAHRSVRRSANAVMACEVSARATFAAAKRRGWLTILDASALHHATQDRLCRPKRARSLHERFAAVKDSEVALADCVVTVSEFARESYLAAGVPGEKVRTLPLGVDVELFVPRRRASAEGYHFVFVGAASRVKGLDLLLEAFREVVRIAPRTRLTVSGPKGDAEGFLKSSVEQNTSALGSIDQKQLAAVIGSADCLVLPSRGDSFGLVVAEALACGVPVIVSDAVGAKTLVIEGRNGWIVPSGDLSALRSRMLECVKAPAVSASMRDAARHSAENWSWERYYHGLRTLVSEIVSLRRA